MGVKFGDDEAKFAYNHTHQIPKTKPYFSTLRPANSSHNSWKKKLKPEVYVQVDLVCGMPNTWLSPDWLSTDRLRKRKKTQVIKGILKWIHQNKALELSLFLLKLCVCFQNMFLKPNIS